MMYNFVITLYVIMAILVVTECKHPFRREQSRRKLVEMGNGLVLLYLY